MTFKYYCTFYKKEIQLDGKCYGIFAVHDCFVEHPDYINRDHSKCKFIDVKEGEK